MKCKPDVTYDFYWYEMNLSARREWVGSPFSQEGLCFHGVFGDPASPFYCDNADPGVHYTSEESHYTGSGVPI